MHTHKLITLACPHLFALQSGFVKTSSSCSPHAHFLVGNGGHELLEVDLAAVVVVNVVEQRLNCEGGRVDAQGLESSLQQQMGQ